MAEKKAFISHSTQDDAYVAQLGNHYRKMGYENVFNDIDSIQAGTDFTDAIHEAIKDTDRLVLVLSKHSALSKWVKWEWELGKFYKKELHPIRIDDCELPDYLANIHVDDLRTHIDTRQQNAPSRLLRHAPKHLFGRETELAMLDDAWAQRESTHILSLIAFGGSGKTSLVAKWMTDSLAAKGWPGVDRYFDWSFYSQGSREASQSSADLFLSEALKFFGDPDPTLGGPHDRGERLAGLIKQHHALLILDGLEPLQFPGIDKARPGELKDEGLRTLLVNLAMGHPGLCIVTSRESISDLRPFRTGVCPEEELNMLNQDAAISLLRYLQINGTDEELVKACEEVGGHALTLKMLGRFLADAHGGDIRKRDVVTFYQAGEHFTQRNAFGVITAYEEWLAQDSSVNSLSASKGSATRIGRPTYALEILRLTGLFDRPVDPGCLAALRQPPAIPGLTDSIVTLSKIDWNLALKGLERLHLITLNELSSGSHAPSSYGIDAHPLIREYFAEKLKVDQPGAFAAGHSRLFDYLCESTDEKPGTLGGLQPLYQAVGHGCLAQRQQEALKVFQKRILRRELKKGVRTEFFSTDKLGAIGSDLSATASFFDEVWDKPTPRLNNLLQAWLLSEAAFLLRAMGRLPESVQPMHLAMQARENLGQLKAAAGSANNLSEIYGFLGNLPSSIDYGVQAAKIAINAREKFQQVSTLATVAFHQFLDGDSKSAQEAFHLAEQIQKRFRPVYPILGGIAGFRYCEFLLRKLDVLYWRAFLLRSPLKSKGLLNICKKVQSRATRKVPYGEPSLIATALDQTLLARVAAFRGFEPDNGKIAESFSSKVHSLAEQALGSLRKAGQVHFIPVGLLHCGWTNCVMGNIEAGCKSFDEAQLIAERGPMPLYLADIHLHRARLFHDRDELAKAKALIQKHGYRRRTEELADAEGAAVNW